MQTQTSQPKQWFRDLVVKITSLSEQFDLDPIQSSIFREQIIDLCKNQFKAGNKSGAAWAFKQSKLSSMQG